MKTVDVKVVFTDGDITTWSNVVNPKVRNGILSFASISGKKITGSISCPLTSVKFWQIIK